MRILALESSCDESAVAVYDDAAGLLSHEIHSQIDLHRLYGGVVPELASRDHVRRLLPLLRTALADAKTAPDQTRRRGLYRRSRADRRVADRRGARPVAGLCAGTCRRSPCITSKAICSRRCSRTIRRRFRTWRCWSRAATPCSSTCAAPGRYAVLGETRDDAAGEAFDKSAKLLGLPYPGGPELAKLAAAGQRAALRISAAHARSRRARVQLLGPEDRGVAGGEGVRAQRARSMTPRAPTSPPACRRPSSIRWSAKTLRALEQTGYDALVVAGGVGANRSLRERLAEGASSALGARVLLPAHRVLHRQCRHDRGGRHGAAQGGLARSAGDPRARAAGR